MRTPRVEEVDQPDVLATVEDDVLAVEVAVDPRLEEGVARASRQMGESLFVKTADVRH